MVYVNRPARLKEIREANIALTSACPMRCGYCFIDKEARRDLPLEAALQAAAFILASPGRRKAIHLYGGEPLMRFDLVKAVLSFAKGEAERLGKELFFGICSNGVLLRKEHLSFLRREGAHLSISLNGSRHVHDRHRRLKNGAGSFELISRRLPEVLDALGPHGVTALMCVHPQAAETMPEDFRDLAAMGFRIINIEVIHGFPWSPKQREAFARGLAQIEDYAFRSAREGLFLYVESFLRYLRGRDAAFEICPVHSSLCVLPDGRFTLYPHPLLDRGAARPEDVVGEAASGWLGRFRACGFDEAGEECRSCARRYYRPGRLGDGSEVFAQRCAAFKGMARRALARAAGEPVLREYLKSGLRCALRYQA